MKTKTPIIILFLVSMVSLFYNGCNTAEDSQYTLAVTVAAGAAGTPATGSYTYAENDIVNYSYSLQPGYRNLTVTLDGTPLASSGAITVTGNHTLVVSAEQIDIRGVWRGRFHWEGDSCFFRVEFSGDLSSGLSTGMFDWIGYDGNGQFTLNGIQIQFTLVFLNGPAPADTTLTCTGSLSGEDHMSGDWIYSYPGGEISGDWNLDRQ